MIVAQDISINWCITLNRAVQYVSIRYTQRLVQAGIEPSLGNKGDSYDKALAETINGPYKAELIHCRAPWKTEGGAGVD